MAGMPKQKCCCGTPCCPHCTSAFPDSWEFTIIPPTHDEDGDCCDNQAACNLFGGTFTLDYIDLQDCNEGDPDYVPCGYWQSAPFTVNCQDEADATHSAIVVLVAYYQPSTDSCFFLLAFSAARFIENQPCEVSVLCRPSCDDLIEKMYASYTTNFDALTDCDNIILDLTCFGAYCEAWPLTLTIERV